jgi:DNA-binding GntR family transcriptional regulator
LVAEPSAVDAGDESPRLDRIQQTSLRDQVVGAIRDAIIQGKFRPGEKVPELELTEQLGVSRTPIREAIRVLEQQGLLEVRPKNGTYVARVKWDEARGGLVVRATLEELAVRESLEHLDRDEWKELCDGLEQLLEEMRDAVGRGDPTGATERDVEFHTRLIAAAANPYLSRAWRSAGLAFLVWSPERELYPIPQAEGSVVFVARHEELLAVLRAGEPDACAAALRSHILRKLDDIERLRGRT